MNDNDNNNERKLSPLCFILIGVFVAALWGIAAGNYLFVNKPIRFHENVLWKNTVLMLFVVFIYAFGSGYLKYSPVMINFLKILAISFVFSVPYFAALVLTTAVSIDVVLRILPGEMMAIVFLFVWIVSDEIAPEIGEHITKHTIIITILCLVTAFIMGLLKMPTVAALPLSFLSSLLYILWLLMKAKIKSKKSMRLENGNRDNSEQDEGTSSDCYKNPPPLSELATTNGAETQAQRSQGSVDHI